MQSKFNIFMYVVKKRSQTLTILKLHLTNYELRHYYENVQQFLTQCTSLPNIKLKKTCLDEVPRGRLRICLFRDVTHFNIKQI